MVCVGREHFASDIGVKFITWLTLTGDDHAAQEILGRVRTGEGDRGDLAHLIAAAPEEAAGTGLGLTWPPGALALVIGVGLVIGDTAFLRKGHSKRLRRLAQDVSS